MTALPPTSRTDITGSRNTKAETKRSTTARIIKAMHAAGATPYGWQVRSILATLVANHELPTDEDVLRALMAAPWFPKPRIRRYRVGDPGWRLSA